MSEEIKSYVASVVELTVRAAVYTAESASVRLRFTAFTEAELSKKYSELALKAAKEPREDA